MNESHNLGNVDAMTYNGNEVETLTLDGTTIWEGFKDYSIAVTATFDEETRMITVTVIAGKHLQRWNYEASINGNRQYHNDYYPIYTSDTKTIQLGRDKITGELSPIASSLDGTWDISVTGWPSFHETYENSGPKSTTVEVTTPETLTITNLTPDATMQHVYDTTWGSVGHDDGAIIKIDEPSDRNIDFYHLKITDQRTGALIRNWHSAHRFRIREDHYYQGLPETHRAFEIIWGWSASTGNESSEGYHKWQTIGKKGGGILRFFVEKDSDTGSSNNATADSSIAVTAAPKGQRIWDCIRDIHANPSNYEVIVRDTLTTVDTQMTALLPDRIVDDFTKITFNKYFYSIRQSGSGGSFSSTLLDFTQSPQKYRVQVRGYDYSTLSYLDYLNIPFENSNKLDVTLTAVGLPKYSRQFGLPDGHNPKTTREPSLHQEWTYTVPAGMKSIEVMGAGGGGGSWAAHDGGYGQLARPGGAGSGFIAKFESVQWEEVSNKQLSLDVSSSVTLQSTENILQIVYGVGGSPRKFRYFTGFNPTTKKMTYDQYFYSTKESSGEFTISTSSSSPTVVGRENDAYSITMWYSSSDKLLYLTTGASSLEDSQLSGNSESGLTGDYGHATYATATSLKAGDVLSGYWGSAGGSGYYNGGVGAAGSSTTLKLNGTLLVTAHPGGNASGSASGANGVATREAGWDSHATSLTLHQGTAYTGVLYGGDGSCPACGYDPWGYVNSPSYNVSHIGVPVHDESDGGLAQMTGYIIITEVGEGFE